MFVCRPTLVIAGIAICSSLLVTAQSDGMREGARLRAEGPYRAGIEYMHQEAFDAAAKAFEEAIAFDSSFDMAHYMLGRAHLARKQYVAAVYALTNARNLYLAEANHQFRTKGDEQRHRRDRLADLDLLIQELRARTPQTYQIREQLRQLEERKRQVEDMERASDFDPATLVPAFVSLSLGSAQFRAGQLLEAEKAYRQAIAADPKIGEAHNNLAVVYLETRRYAEAARAVRDAEKTGFTVSPALKEAIAKRSKQ